MRLEEPLRLGGLAAILAGVLLLISELIGILPLGFLPFEVHGDELAIYGFLGIDGYLGVLLIVLIQLGLVGLYANEAKTAGAMGLISFFIAFIGGRLALNPSFADPLTKATLSESGGESIGLWWTLVIFASIFVLGWVLFGVATLRAGIYPWAAAALLIVGVLFLFAPLPLSGVIFAVAVAWMGYVLLAERDGEETLRLENPLRWGGLAALLAGVLLFISELVNLYLGYVDPGAALSILPIDPWLGLLLAALVQLGLVGLYASQAKATGALGVVGVLVAFGGAWLVMGGSFMDSMARQTAWPVGEPEEFWGPLALLGLTFVLGWVLFGVATLRAGIYPPATSALLIIGGLILLLPLPLSGIIFAGSLAWMGYLLFTERVNQEASQPSRARASG